MSHSPAVSGTQASSSSSPSASQVSTASAATAHSTARGKTHISRALERYLRWLGVKTRVYSIGDYRRKVLGGAENVPHDYFQTKSVYCLLAGCRLTLCSAQVRGDQRTPASHQDRARRPDHGLFRRTGRAGRHLRCQQWQYRREKDYF